MADSIAPAFAVWLVFSGRGRRRPCGRNQASDDRRAARLNQAAFGLVGSCPQDEESDPPALLAETVW